MPGWLRRNALLASAARRSLPVRVAALGAMATVLVLLAALDAVSGAPMVLYFWTVLGFATTGLLVGLALRRTPWSLAPLVPIALAGVLALGGSDAAFHDGVGEKTWGPSQLASQYRLGIGRATLDLRHLSTVATTPRTTRVTGGVGQVRILLPVDANIEVQANIHIGVVESHVDGDSRQDIQVAGTRKGPDRFSLRRTGPPGPASSSMSTSPTGRCSSSAPEAPHRPG